MDVIMYMWGWCEKVSDRELPGLGKWWNATNSSFVPPHSRPNGDQYCRRITLCIDITSFVLLDMIDTKDIGNPIFPECCA